MGDFSTDTAVRQDADGRLNATLSQDWEIWGPNGGYVAAIALRAAGLVAPEGHRPAVFSCQYLSAGRFADVEIEVDPVRKGRSAWCLNVALVQAGKRFLQAQVWTTDRAVGPTHRDAQPPAVANWRELREIREILGPDAPLHRFWSHIDQKPVQFRPPGERDPRGARAEGWYRLREFDPAAAGPYLDAARALLLIDTMPWPTYWRSLADPPTYIAPSLDLTVWLHQSAQDAEWLLFDARADVSTGGLIHGGARVWTDDGRLIATGGSQLLVVDRAS